LVGVFFINQLFFLTCFIWPLTIMSPGVFERISDVRYKYSFLGIMFKTYQRIDNLNDKDYFRYFSRNIFPLAFTFVIFLVSSPSNFGFAILGTVGFELYYKFVIKRWDIFNEANSNDQGTGQENLSEESTPESSPNPENHQIDND